MLKWIAIPAVSLLAMLPTASNAQARLRDSRGDRQRIAGQLAIVVTA